MKTYRGIITELPENGIFVFGSNTEGRHGKGAALTAVRNFGAKYGIPRGMQGRSYAIVTKDLTKINHPSVPKSRIIMQISDLYLLAKEVPEYDFYIAYGIGSNLNGYSPQEMADMFIGSFNIPDNIVFNEDFAKLM